MKKWILFFLLLSSASLNGAIIQRHEGKLISYNQETALIITSKGKQRVPLKMLRVDQRSELHLYLSKTVQFSVFHHEELAQAR